MVQRIIVKKGSYRDSISLMKISNEVSKLRGVSQTAVVMATPLNKRFLADVGFKGGEIEGAGPDDLIVAVEAKSEEVVRSTLSKIEETLSPKESSEAGEARPLTLASAIELMPGANLALISVPGRFAKGEAMNAIDRRLNVFLFSSNLSADDELELKRAAQDRS